MASSNAARGRRADRPRASARARPAADATSTDAGDAAAWRDGIVSRFLELRPTLIARMQASIPPELHAELETVTGRQLQALTRLPVEGLTMRRLATTLGVSGAAACVLADRLAAQGLAKRQADPDDRRVVRLVPSKHGRAVAQRYLEAQRHATTALLARLSDEQVTAWIDIMETLAADSEGAKTSEGAESDDSGAAARAGRAGDATAADTGDEPTAGRTGKPPGERARNRPADREAATRTDLVGATR